jgi:mono/diheme cytochrome c family protein
MDSKTTPQCGCNAVAAVRLLLVTAMGIVMVSMTSAQNIATTAGDNQAISSSTNGSPTYLRDVQPILMGNCSRCHNQESRFVYNWLDYKTAYADRWEIERRIWDSWKGAYYKESMPIANSPESLAITDDQRALIRQWVLDGAPKGTLPVANVAKTKAEKIQLGSHLFASICAACHQPNGLGRPNVFPPLAGSDFLNADKKRAIGIVIHGRQGELVVNGQTFNNSMPSFPLTDEDIADVLTYVYNSFGNSGLEVTPQEVQAIRMEPYTPPATPAPAVNNQFE